MRRFLHRMQPAGQDSLLRAGRRRGRSFAFTQSRVSGGIERQRCSLFPLTSSQSSCFSWILTGDLPGNQIELVQVLLVLNGNLLHGLSTDRLRAVDRSGETVRFGFEALFRLIVLTKFA